MTLLSISSRLLLSSFCTYIQCGFSKVLLLTVRTFENPLRPAGRVLVGKARSIWSRGLWFSLRTRNRGICQVRWCANSVSRGMGSTTLRLFSTRSVPYHNTTYPPSCGPAVSLSIVDSFQTRSLHVESSKCGMSFQPHTLTHEPLYTS